eukprot:284073-Pyramimonas_sp.AAC.2
MAATALSPASSIARTLAPVTTTPLSKVQQHTRWASKNPHANAIGGVTLCKPCMQRTHPLRCSQGASNMEPWSSHAVTRRAVLQKQIALSAGALLVSGLPSSASEVLYPLPGAN